MKPTLDLVAAISAAEKRVDKEQLIFNAIMAGERNFFIGAQLAYDPFVAYGLKKVAEITEDDGSPGEVSFHDFQIIVNRLQAGSLSARDAKRLVDDTALRCSTPIWNAFYRRILLRDLKLGITPQTINKVLRKAIDVKPEIAAFLVPSFSCAEPQALEAARLNGEKLVDVKIEGTRMLAILSPTSSPRLYSATGKTISAPQDVVSGLSRLSVMLPQTLVLDGVMTSRCATDLMAPPTMGDALFYAVFDILPFDDFRGARATSQEQRHAVLSSLVTSGALKEAVGPHVYVVPKSRIDLASGALTRLLEEARAAGHKAVIAKEPRETYGAKRAWAEIKTLT